jgi:hypothetical protein
MQWYLRAHNILGLAIGSLCLTMATWWLAGMTLPVPQLLQGRVASVGIELLLASLFAPLFAWGCRDAVVAFEAMRSRRLRIADTVLLCFLLLPAGLVAALAFTAGEGQLALDMLRNILFFTGFAAVTVSLFGDRLGGTLPVLYFMVVGIFGQGNDGQPASWAFVRGHASWWSACAVGALLAVVTLFFGKLARSRILLRSGIEQYRG